MATKKELLQAQAYSRRRLITTFVSGTPGGKELEPTKPMRAVVSGVALSVLLVIGSLVFGLINPSLPDGWDDNTLLIAKESGARYVTIKGTLYPVINTTSARLLIPSKAFKIVTVDDDHISSAPRGETIGILGAPDALPKSEQLARERWSACLAAPSHENGPAGIATIVDPVRPAAEPADKAIVVSVKDVPYLIKGGYRYRIELGESPGILRAIEMADQQIIPVTAKWLQLFRPGTDLGPLTIEGAGDQPPEPVVIDGVSLSVGTVIRDSGKTDPSPYVLTAEGDLATLSPFAASLYAIGSGADFKPVEVTGSEIADLDNATFSVSPIDWPTERLQAFATDQDVCAIMSASPSSTGVATLGAATPTDPAVVEPYRAESGLMVTGTYVSSGSGMVLRAIASGDGAVAQGTELDYDLDRGNAFLVDETGTLFPLPGADVEILGQLGYALDDVFDVPASWASLFPVGPALAAKDAMRPPSLTAPSDGDD